MENTWCTFFFQTVMGLIVVVCEQVMALKDAYASKVVEQQRAALKHSALWIGLVVAIGVGVCWITWDTYNAAELSEVSRSKGFLRVSFLYLFTAFALLFYRILNLCKYAYYCKKKELFFRQRKLLLIEITLFIVAFGLLYLVRPELLYGPYL